MEIRRLIAWALVASFAGTVSAGPKWEAINGYPEVMRLVNTKIKAIVTDAPPYRPTHRLCVEIPRNESPAGCPIAHGNNRIHVDLPAAEHGGLDMLDSAKLALAQGRLVVLHVDASTRLPNPQGDARCRVTRLVVHKKP